MEVEEKNMVLKFEDYKKKVPNEAQKKFIELARYIRQKDYSKGNGNSELSSHYQGLLRALEIATKEDGERGFDAAWQALSEDNERLKEWTKLVTAVSPSEEEPS